LANHRIVKQTEQVKRLFLFVLSGTLIFESRACEICGCGVNNFYIGILPQFNHTFFGARYHFNSFNTRLQSDPTQYSKEFYQTLELWGGWNLGKRVQLLAFVPFNHNYQNSDEGVMKMSGLGDVVALANYKVLDVSSVNGKDGIFSQQLWIGGGIKFSTGKFEIDANDPDVASAANMQLGSGSTDILLNAMYNVRIDKFGINTTATYKLNSTNKDQYKFGNKFLASSFAYYPLPVSKTVISPNVGILYEKGYPSELYGSKIDLTGGSVLQASAGVEISFSKIAIGFNAQLPVAQNFAENQTTQKLRGMAHVSFAL
jgi:hypothetical protein